MESQQQPNIPPFIEHLLCVRHYVKHALYNKRLVTVTRRLSSLDTIDILSQIICHEGLLLQYEMFSTVSDLYCLDASCTTSQVLTMKSVSRHCECLQRGAVLPHFSLPGGGHSVESD